MIEKVSKSAITDAFWKAFQDKDPQAPDEYYLLRFGGSNAALATELADLVVSGSKGQRRHCCEISSTEGSRCFRNQDSFRY
jgi:hypothetical protein